MIGLKCLYVGFNGFVHMLILVFLQKTHSISKMLQTFTFQGLIGDICALDKRHYCDDVIQREIKLLCIQ